MNNYNRRGIGLMGAYEDHIEPLLSGWWERGARRVSEPVTARSKPSVSTFLVPVPAPKRRKINRKPKRKHESIKVAKAIPAEPKVEGAWAVKESPYRCNECGCVNNFAINSMCLNDCYRVYSYDEWQGLFYGFDSWEPEFEGNSAPQDRQLWKEHAKEAFLSHTEGWPYA